jgi:cytochrome c peroxidase
MRLYRTSLAVWLAACLGAIMLASVAVAQSYAGVSFAGWSGEEIALMSSLRLSLLEAAPSDPSNRVEANPAAMQLGQRLFADRRFSGNGAVACASCHQPDRQFQDGRAVGQGMAMGTRRTMPITGTGHSPFLFWDGRKDSLWAQALGPMEDAAEHGGNRVAFAHLMQAYYRPEYEALFGVLPDLSQLPQAAGPLGTPSQRAAWNAMSEAQRESVSRVFANMGKALAAYEKSLRFSPSRMDRYVEGVLRRDPASSAELTASEKAGLRIFIGKGRCITCHNGPLLSDQHFHNTGIAPRLPGVQDAGRSAAIARLRADEFNCLGKFSDAKPEQCDELRFMVDADASTDGAFKTPSLRNVALRAPYMYAGQLATLDDVVRHYARAPAAATGHSELKAVALSEREFAELVSFLGALSELPAR